jgi:hypothetical protein
MSNRRQFLKQTAGAALLGLAAGVTTNGLAASPKMATSVSRRTRPVAIAMWDFSWLLRHYPTGEFENWDVVLDGLVKRGYNAIRFDVFPALVAPDSEGRVIEEHAFPKADWKPVMWGGQYSTTIRPRRALKEFIPRCLDRGLLLVPATWFFGSGVERVEGVDGFIRVWDHTLGFLKENGLLHNIYYVDLLNESPLFHGFSWLSRHMDKSQKEQEAKASPDGVHEWKAKPGEYNDEASRAAYTDFANEVLTRMQAKWPELDFLFSLTYNGSADWRVMAPTPIAALDVHYWFVMNPLLPDQAGYWENIHGLADNDLQFPKVQSALLKNWTTHKSKLVEWMDQNMAEVANLGQRYQKPVGNTEGWGTINWLDHPALTWDIIKESGEICARLGARHGYRFNCSSNFTHPQFPRLWDDVAWHKKVTAIIRSASVHGTGERE